MYYPFFTFASLCTSFCLVLYGQFNKLGGSNRMAGTSQIIAKVPRRSNLELYRIVCMLMIVAHHYVVNSGLTWGGPLDDESFSINSIFLALFGAWGKTGINCFLMITGYFMCTSKITLRKFLKLMAQIYLYKLLIYLLFLASGHESLSVMRIVKLLMPFWGFQTDFFLDNLSSEHVQTTA